MLAFVIRRLVEAVFVMLTVALLAFVLFRFVGDPVNQMVGQDTSLAERMQLRRELGLDDPALTDEQLIAAMLTHPLLINRPIVVTPLGVKLCRPSEVVLDILPDLQRGGFTKEDGEVVVDKNGVHRR